MDVKARGQGPLRKYAGPVRSTRDELLIVSQKDIRAIVAN
jgi:hypothetical protein